MHPKNVSINPKNVSIKLNNLIYKFDFKVKKYPQNCLKIVKRFKNDEKPFAPAFLGITQTILHCPKTPPRRHRAAPREGIFGTASPYIRLAAIAVPSLYVCFLPHPSMKSHRLCRGFAPAPPVSPPTARKQGAGYALRPASSLKRWVASTLSRSSRLRGRCANLDRLPAPQQWQICANSPNLRFPAFYVDTYVGRIGKG